MSARRPVLGAAEARQLAEAITVERAQGLYVDMMTMLALHLGQLAAMPLSQLLDVNDRMQVLGPLVEPTAYHRGGGQNLADQRKLLAAAIDLQRVMWEIGGAA